MADNKSVKDATNTTFTGAADELSDSSFSPKVTLVDGTGSPTPISPATSGKQDTMIASLSVLDDWDESDRAKVNPIVGQAGVAAGAGSVSATVQRVTLASDDPLVALQTAASASLTSLVSAATSAQLLAANAARKGLILVNTDANDVLIKYGTTASATSFTAIVPGNRGQWEMPYPIYTGRIDAIWDADGSGSLYATEL